MKPIKAISNLIVTAVNKSTSVVERGLNAIEYIAEAGELLAEDFKDETSFDISKSKAARTKEMAEFERELEEMSQDTKE
jgi:hypothetical protein